MTGQQLRNSILQEAIQGRLVPNVLQPGEKTGAELLQDILAERQKKENEEKGKKARKLTISIIEEDPWELPEGWCWCKIDDLCQTIGNKDNQIKSSEIKPTGLFPVVSQGQAIIDGYFDDKKKVINEIPIIIFGDHTKNVKYIDFPFIIGADGTKVLSPFPHIYAKWFYYTVLYFASIVLYDRGYARHYSLLNKETFPFPPLSIQKAIVAKIEELLPLVDEYDKAAGELKALNETLPDKLRKSVLQEAIHGRLVPNDIPEGEATAPELLQQILKERQDRGNKEKGKKAKKLTLSTIEEEPWELPEGWCWCKLGDVFEMQAGKNINASKIKDVPSDAFPYPCYGGNGIRGYVKSQNTTGIHTIVGRQGALCGNIKYAEGPFYATEHAVVVSMTICDVMWSYYFLIACDLNQYATKTAQPGLSVAKILDTCFPLPPLSIQHRIVEKIEELFSAINTL